MTFVEERMLPKNLDAERSVLGAVLLHEEALHQVADRLRPKDFFRDAHQRIYQAMLALSEGRRAIDLVTLREHLTRAGELDEVGGPAYIASLIDGVPRSLNIVHYASIVTEKSRLRQGIAAATAMVAEAYNAGEDAGEILSRGAEALFAVASPAARGRAVAIGELAPGALRTLELSHATPGVASGLSTGYMALDDMTAGLQSSDLVLLAGRTSLGKTALGLNIARHVAGQGRHVLIFSLEMSQAQLYARLLAAEARVDSHHMRSGRLGERDWGKVSHAMTTLADLPLYIDDVAGLSPLELRARARVVRAERGGLDLIVVDYIQLMRGAGRFENRTQEIGTISFGLKALAKEFDVPVLALCQLARSAETGRRRPQLSDLRESGSLEQDADLVLFIYRSDALPNAPAETEGIAELIIGKQRNGPTGIVKLVFIKQYARFESLAQDS